MKFTRCFQSIDRLLLNKLLYFTNKYFSALRVGLLYLVVANTFPGTGNILTV